MGLYRSVVAAAIIVIAFILLMVFLNVMLKIALLIALIAFAYYWFQRALRFRRRGRE